MTKKIEAFGNVFLTTGTRKSTSGATTIKASAGILERIIVNDCGQRCVVAIKDGTETKMLFTLQQNTDASRTAYEIPCGFDFSTSLIAELYKLDPVLFLNFNNNSTTSCEDLSGSNTDGTMRFMTGARNRLEDAERGKHIAFTGTEYITFGDILDWDLSSEARSFCFWIRSSAGNHMIITKRTGTGFGWDLRKFSTKIEIQAEDAGAGRFNAIMTTALTNAVWTHVTMTYDGSGSTSGITFYLNGNVDTTVSVTDTLTGTSANAISFRISGRVGDKFFCVGRLDEIMLFDRELAASEVEYIYRNGYGYGPVDGARLGDITLVFE